MAGPALNAAPNRAAGSGDEDVSGTDRTPGTLRYAIAIATALAVVIFTFAYFVFV